MRRSVIILAGILFLSPLAAEGQVVPPAQKKIDRLKQLRVVLPESIRLNRNEILLFAPEKPGRPGNRLEATVLPVNAGDKTVLWESSDASVVTIDAEGWLGPVKAGSAVVRAVTRANKLSAECRVVVEARDERFGNTFSNHMNHGRMAHQGSWIYFADPARGSRLSKMKIGGDEIIPLSDDAVSYINIDGDTIHYVNGSDGNRLYSIDIYGKNRKWLNDSSQVFGAQRYGQEILFGALDPNGRVILYTIKPDGTDRRVVDWPGLGSVAAFFRVEDSVVYTLSRPGSVGLILIRPLEPASAAIQALDAEHRGFVVPLTEQFGRFPIVTIFYITKAGEIRRIIHPTLPAKKTDNLVASMRHPVRTLSCHRGWVFYGNDLGLNKFHMSQHSQHQLLVRIPPDSVAIPFPAPTDMTSDDFWVYYYVIPQKNGATHLYRVKSDGLNNSLVR